MKEELNIATILNDKPIGTKLWSDTFGEVSLCNVEEDRFEVKDRNSLSWIYNAYGSLDKYGGTLSIFPSKFMRDWSKFAWKKGDVLKSGVDNLCIFEEWDNDSYTEFNANFITDRYNGGVLETKDWSKETDENIIKQYIAKIEEIKGGKLNLSTLEIEKQPEFKDGDIVFMKGVEDKYTANCIFILKGKYNGGEKKAVYYAFCNIDDNFACPECGYVRVHSTLHLATDSEKKRLFNALAKEGKCWSPDTLQIEDLPKKYEFKTMDWCLMKQHFNVWCLCQYAFKNDRYSSTYFAIGGNAYDECIPYNDQTAHLLGTTDEWKGGEV